MIFEEKFLEPSIDCNKVCLVQKENNCASMNKNVLETLKFLFHRKITF